MVKTARNINAAFWSLLSDEIESEVDIFFFGLTLIPAAGSRMLSTRPPQYVNELLGFRG